MDFEFNLQRWSQDDFVAFSSLPIYSFIWTDKSFYDSTRRFFTETRVVPKISAQKLANQEMFKKAQNIAKDTSVKYENGKLVYPQGVIAAYNKLKLETAGNMQKA